MMIVRTVKVGEVTLPFDEERTVDDVSKEIRSNFGFTAGGLVDGDNVCLLGRIFIKDAFGELAWDCKLRLGANKVFFYRSVVAM
jgi:hypothetical protein